MPSWLQISKMSIVNKLNFLALHERMQEVMMSMSAHVIHTTYMGIWVGRMYIT
jgi:hypothetical protein